MNPFRKSFDDILNGILVDFRNIFPDVDTAKGSLAYMKAAGYASGLWGLYRYQEWISDQIFPDTAASEKLEHHSWVRGLARKSGEKDAQLLARLLEYIRRPPAGGNQYDYEKWALAQEGVKAAYSVPMGQGLGTVDVVILADESTQESEIPSQDLLDSVREYIVDLCPTAVKYLRVLAPTLIEVDVTMVLTGDLADATTTASDLTAWLNAFEPGQDLTLVKLTNIAVVNGADDVTLTAPAANVTTTAYEMIRAGVVDVG